jgi:hypothetical protein
MSSRFFYGGGSDSDSSSSDEEELYSDREEEEKSEEEESSEEEDETSEEEESDEETGARKFLKDVASDSEEEEEEEKVTVVKSAKDKRLDELENTIKLIENAKKINDWAVISTGAFLFLSHAAICGDGNMPGGLNVLDGLTWDNRVRQAEPTGCKDHAIWSNSQDLHQSRCRP